MKVLEIRRSALLFWSIVVVAVALPRVLSQTALPEYLFSDDSHSYLFAAFNWTQSGDWETSPRRGPLYSLLIAGTLHAFQNLNALVSLQHAIGAGAVLLVIDLLWLAVPERLRPAALLAAVSFAVCGYVIYFENLVRNEILLLFFSALTFAAWGWFLLRRKDGALLLAGLAFSLATSLKNLLLPLPVFIAIFLLADHVPRGVKLRRLALLLVGISLPWLVQGAIEGISGKKTAPAPQSGILLYGRVAQWTVLEGGGQPEIKALIASDIAAYRALPRLNNNIILKRTAVPKIYRWVKARQGSEVQVNRICRDLAFEAIAAQPARWLVQIGTDLQRLLWKMEFPLASPTADDLADARLSTTKMKHQHPMLRQQEVLDALGRPELPARLRSYHASTAGAWLFWWKPVLLTSLGLPLLLWLERDATRRRFWLTAAGVWFFNVAIICTVGRPIPRYLLATLPIMFWVLAGMFLHLAGAILRWRNEVKM